MFTIFKDHCTNPKQNSHKHVSVSLVYIGTFSCNLQLSSTNTKTGVNINSNQMHVTGGNPLTNNHVLKPHTFSDKQIQALSRTCDTDSRIFKEIVSSQGLSRP